MKSLLQGLSRLNAAANHDFCPWANRYVYWLKEPVGWFVIATGASLLVGAFLSPIGWTVAAGLVAILILGLGFPWLAVRAVRCQLAPTIKEIHEQQDTHLELTIRNYLPIPILGLLVEGYLSQPFSRTEASDHVPDVGLAQVPALSQATYRLAIQPQFRGQYPIQVPQIACSFPFGIWTARRPVSRVEPVTVWPMLIPASGDLEIVGKQLADVGNGNRASSQGDFMGVREFRRGDSLRSIHWVQSAKQDNLIVCERGGPQKQAIELDLQTHPCFGSADEVRENLAWRVRIMASLIDLAVSRHLPFKLLIDGSSLSQPGMSGRNGCPRSRFTAWDQLASIPVDGFDNRAVASCPCMAESLQTSRITISARSEIGTTLPAHCIRVKMQQPSGGGRRASQVSVCEVDLDQDIAAQLTHLFMEASRESYAA
jgi:uncharacterized protein (DUF58 family)